MAPMSTRKENISSATLSYPGLRRDDDSGDLGPWTPSTFSSKSKEGGQNWVRTPAQDQEGMSGSLEGDLDS